MNYRLAKQLKNAGFRNSYWEPSIEAEHPTLEELIEAIGIEFGNLSRTAGLAWTAFSSSDPDEAPLTGRGNSPSDAVAHLWLALNERK